jgi:large subunit ribosomal protein L9
MPRTIELLLTENIENLGIVGDVVDVKPGYARNYLVPLGYAVKPTEGAKKALAERRAEVERELAALRKQLEQLVEKLEGAEVTLERSCNDQGWLYGSVTQHDIATALQEAGFNQVTDRHIRIGAAIKRIDSYEIPVQLDKDLRTEIKLWVVADRELNLGRSDEQETPTEEEGAAPAENETVAEEHASS